MLTSRLQALRKKLMKCDLDAILITNLKNIYYLTGFWGSSATVFVSQKQCVLMTDSRYIIYAKKTVKEFDIIDTADDFKTIKDLLASDTLKIVGFESSVPFSYYQRLVTLSDNITWDAQAGFVEELRLIKDEKEIKTIQKACQISDQAYLDLLDFVKVGKTELELATFLDFRMRELGAAGLSFETIVASGERSAMPHGAPTDKAIAYGDAVTVDFGCYYHHYVSDMTRTFYVGEVTDFQRGLYETVLSSNQTLIERVQSGMTYADYDQVARSVIDQAGYGEYFTHGIGHGIGLDIHEGPFFKKGDKRLLQAGMVITDEPGIYVENQSGVRIEDDLVITKEGCRVLTKAPKELILI